MTTKERPAKFLPWMQDWSIAKLDAEGDQAMIDEITTFGGYHPSGVYAEVLDIQEFCICHCEMFHRYLHRIEAGVRKTESEFPDQAAVWFKFRGRYPGLEHGTAMESADAKEYCIGQMDLATRIFGIVRKMGKDMKKERREGVGTSRTRRFEFTTALLMFYRRIELEKREEMKMEG